MLRTHARILCRNLAIATAGVTALVLGFPRTATAAKNVIALDADFALPVQAPTTNTGGGGALRFGRQYTLLLLRLTPEVGLGYFKFSGESDTTLYRGFAGARLAVGRVIEPSVYAHIGASRLNRLPTHRFAPVLDAGVALDLTVIPFVNLGIHAAYNAVLPRTDDTAFRWVSVGLHGAIVF